MEGDIVPEHQQTRAEPEENGLAAGCPMAALLETLTRPWTLHILWLLSTHGPMRFGALKRNVEGISARLLTVRLRTLEDEGFVRRTAKGGKVPAVTYSPTVKAEGMDAVMALLHRLSQEWREAALEAERKQ